MVFSLLALVCVSVLTGGLIGRRYARMEFERRSDPSHWNETAMRDLDRALKPTPEQRQKIQDHIDGAVEELKSVRAETIRQSTEIIVRLVGQVDKELTPEQRVAFQRFKPTQSDLSNLNFLNVETRKK
jgi:predicted Holliday junction resolvase-like endonuclease